MPALRAMAVSLLELQADPRGNFVAIHEATGELTFGKMSHHPGHSRRRARAGLNRDP